LIYRSDQFIYQKNCLKLEAKVSKPNPKDHLLAEVFARTVTQSLACSRAHIIGILAENTFMVCMT
jgi:hypothetical protein